MDKIKKILSPHTSDTSHGQSTSTTGATTGATSGQGSHFNGETRSGMAGVAGRDTSSQMPGEFPSEAPQSGYDTTSRTTTGIGHESEDGSTRQNLSSTGNPTNTSSGFGTSTGTPHLGSHGAATTTSGPHTSNLANKADPRVDSDNSRLTGPQTTSGYGGGSTGVSTATSSGPHSSNLANRADPRIDSDNSRLTGSGLTGRETTPGYGTSGAHNNTTSGVPPGVAQIGGSTTDRSYHLGSGTTSSPTAGAHSSSLANKADPRIDSDLDGSRTMGNTAGTAAIGSTTTARSFPLGGTGSSTTGTGGHSSSLADTADPRVDSDHARIGGSGLTGASSGTEYGHTGSNTSGPHSSNLANKADPRVDSDNSRVGGTGITGVSTTGYGNTSSSNTHGHTTHGLERDAGTAGNGAILGSTASRSHDSTSGPHQTLTANLLDPHIRGGSKAHEDAIKHSHGGRSVGGGAEEADRQHKNMGPTSADVTRIGDTNLAQSSGHTGSSHNGRNSAVAGGVGAGVAGLATHEHDKHHNDHGSGLGNTSTTTGTTTTTTTTTGHYGGNHGTTSSGTSQYSDPSNIGSSTSTTAHHHDRDAALGAGAGAAGVGLAHRGKGDSLSEQSHDQHGSRIGGSSNTDQSTTHGGAPEKEGLLQKLTKKLSPGHKSSGHDTESHSTTTDSSHTGRNAALAGGAAGVGGAAYGAHQHGHSSDTNPTTQGTAYGSSDSSYPTGTSTSRAVDPTTSGSSHNYGRDAALVGGAGGVGGAAYAAGRHHDGTSSHTNPDSYGTHGGTNNPSVKSSPLSSTDPTRSGTNTTDHHYGRDAAVVGGAAGVGGAAYEADQHRREKELEKELMKQHKHDEEDFEKDMRKKHKHDEKEHEKDLKKQHKHDEKEHEKDLKKQHKHDEKEAKHHEKDHKGGLFGLTKSHKDDKYTDAEQAEFDRLQREKANPSHHTGTALGTGAVAGAGAYGASQYQGSGTSNTLGSTQGEHGSEHKDIGDHLHGVDRNRGVNGSSGFPDSEGFGDHDSHYNNSGRGPNVATDSEGRHRLHKDPPSSHPAAHATHGGGNLDGNSGVGGTGRDTY